MKRSLKVDSFIINDVFVGFVLGGGKTSEHESGIDGIKSLLGIPNSGDGLIGIDKRKSARPIEPKHVMLDTVKVATGDRGNKTKQTFRVLYVTYNSDVERDQKSLAKALVKHYVLGADTKTFGAWDSDDFVIMSSDEAMHDHIDALAQAITTGDVAAWFGRFDKNPFSPAGIAVMIASRIPEEQLTSMREADIARNNLLAAVKDTGIEERLQAAGLGWYALSPRLAGEEELKRTGYSVVFFLNPHKQSENNAGWFTVEELDQWAAGDGPVPKNPKSALTPA